MISIPVEGSDASSEEDLRPQVVADTVEVLLVQQHLANGPVECTGLAEPRRGQLIII